MLLPFFDGLIPEGWLLEVAERNWKLNPRNRISLLLACCQDCIGAVSIYPLPPPKTHEPLPLPAPAGRGPGLLPRVQPQAFQQAQAKTPAITLMGV